MTRILCAVSALALFAAPAFARDQIRIVGSSTVYPFTTTVAEAFGKATKMKTPVVESNGTGGGMKLFCAGAGDDTPDFTNASRAIKKSEFDDCQKNGVKEIVEVKVGFDGLSVAHSAKAKDLNLTKQQIFLALAKQVPDKDGKLIDNPNKMWSDIDPALPKTKIEVIGPPPTSGTRDSFHELALGAGAETIPAMKALKEQDAKAFDAVWKTMRTDGPYVEAGEDDNLIVQKLQANPDALGVFGYSYLDANRATLSALKIDGVDPTYDNISSDKYKLSRPLFIYAKKGHIDQVPGMKEFLAEYVSAKALGADGYLAKKGIVTLPDAQAATSRENVKSLTVLTGEGLK